MSVSAVPNAAMPRVVLAAALLLIVGACQTSAQLPSSNLVDYRTLYPLAVQMERVTLPLAIEDGGDVLSPAATAELDRFIDTYLRQGHGPLEVAVSEAADDAGAARAWAEAITAFARGKAVRPHELEVLFQAAEDAGESVVLGFQRAAVRLPECGDWSKRSAYDPTNTVHSNFGCATQRNLGLIVANPAHLIGPRPPGFRDTARSNLIIQNWRAGETTAAEEAAAPAAVTGILQ